MNITSYGFPHSEISGSKCNCHYPKLIAACHVLHRLSEPRHSSCALSSLITKKLLIIQLIAVVLLLIPFLAQEINNNKMRCLSHFSKFSNNLSKDISTFIFLYFKDVSISKLFGLPSGALCRGWWAYMDLNHGPRPYQGRALTSWAIRPKQA